MAQQAGARVVVLSEYGITPVTDAVHLEPGAPRCRADRGCAASSVASCSTPAPRRRSRSPITSSPTSTSSRSERVAEVQALLEKLSTASSACSTRRASAPAGLDHPRSGELVCDRRARPLVQLLLLARRRPRARLRAHRRHPPQARLRPGRAVPRSGAARCRWPAVGWKLAQRKLGFRTLLDVIALDTSLVGGSHGRLTDRPEDGPVLISSDARARRRRPVAATAVSDLVLDHVFA